VLHYFLLSQRLTYSCTKANKKRRIPKY
jgi:hypothetical protein